MEQREKEWLSCAETAKLVRARLKERFPGEKFSVKSHTYSMGASINVGWTDGAARSDVEAAVKVFEGSGFDGSIDLKYYIEHYIDAEGRLGLLRCSGTVGSMGYVPGFANELPEGARRVSLGADFVFCNRSISDFKEKLAEVTAWLEPVRATWQNGYDLERRAMNIVYDRRPDESLEDADDRVTYKRDKLEVA